MKTVRKWQVAAGMLGAIGLLGGLVAAAPLGVAALHWLVTRSNTAFDGACLNSVVGRIQAQGLRPGASLELRLEALSDAATLRGRQPVDNRRGREAGNVWASRASTGELRVIVETVDNGHAGRWGYVYSERPPEHAPDGTYEVGGEMSDYLGCTDLAHRVADRWWEAWNCSMD
jgi:hypothetical protein